MIPIVGVTVHPDGALIRRAGTLAAQDGRVVVRGLPLLLDPSSLRASVDGLREVRVELDVSGEDRGDEPAPVTELREATEALARLRSALKALREERQHAAGIAPSWDPEGEPPPAERLLAWASLEDVIGPWVARLDDELLERGREATDLEERVRILTHRVSEQSDEAAWRRWAPTRRAILRVEAEGDVQVEVSYRIAGATWTPAYVLDADATLSAGRFTMRALVAQSTGEDWSSVSLRLTTAPASRSIDVAVLPSLRLGARQPPSPAAWRELPAGLDALFPADLEAAPLPPPPPQAPEELEVEEMDDELDLLTEEQVDAAYDLPMMAKAAPWSAIRDAIGSMGGGPGSAPSAPPAPMARSQSVSRKRARPEPVQAEVSLEVEVDLLDYGRLRMRGYAAAVGQRGRLAAVDDAELLAEAGLPGSAVAQLHRCLVRLTERAERLQVQPLPAHHVLPGPIGGADHRFDATGSVDVPSDSRFHSVAVFTAPVSLDVGYRAVPRHDPRAFRRVTASLARPGALLAGPVDVYVGGALELTAPWAGSRGRGELVLGLGAEDRLKLVRNVRYREEKAGLLGGSRRLNTMIEVEVASSLQRAVRVEILERVPVPSASGGPTVEVTEASPIAKPWEGEPDGPILKGGRVQVLEVAPGGQARAVLGYAVTLGAREELVGGDRRG